MIRHTVLSALLCTTTILGCSGAPNLISTLRPGARLSASEPIAVVPAKIGNPDDLLLPDAIATELLGLGFNIVERTTVAQMAKEKGLDWTEIVNGEEYFKLGKFIDLEAVAIVNSRMDGNGVANASCRVVDVTNGSILLSVTYDQPRPANPTYINYDSPTATAKKMAREFSKLLE